jgi:hypothetical protein
LLIQLILGCTKLQQIRLFGCCFLLGIKNFFQVAFVLSEVRVLIDLKVTRIKIGKPDQNFVF